MPMNPHPAPILPEHTLPSQKNIIRFRESAIPGTDINAHAEQVLTTARSRRRILEGESCCPECDAVVV